MISAEHYGSITVRLIRIPGAVPKSRRFYGAEGDCPDQPGRGISRMPLTFRINPGPAEWEKDLFSWTRPAGFE
jgi:hypothetical protein